jgi:hypothetical protein
MGTAILFLLSALGKGKPEQWLGPQLSQTLAKQNPSLFQRLQKLFQNHQNSPASSRRSPSGWNWLSVPVLNQQTFDKFFFASYQPPPQEEQNNKQKIHEQRFRVVSHLHQIGSLQIEGRIQTQSLPLQSPQSRPFNVTIASERPLQQELEKQLVSHTSSLITALGFTPHIIITKHIDPSWAQPQLSS